MATSKEYMDFVYEQLQSIDALGSIRYKKMFGEYLVYLNEKPFLLVCDNTVMIKKLPELSDLMQNAACGCPYEGAKEHYILDIEDRALVSAAAAIADRVLPLPKPKKPKARQSADKTI